MKVATVTAQISLGVSCLTAIALIIHRRVRGSWNPFQVIKLTPQDKRYYALLEQ